MDSILIFVLDRINRIVGIFKNPGFRMKPGIGNPLHGKSEGHYRPLNPVVPDIAHISAKFLPVGGCYFHGFIRKP